MEKLVPNNISIVSIGVYMQNLTFISKLETIMINCIAIIYQYYDHFYVQEFIRVAWEFNNISVLKINNRHLCFLLLFAGGNVVKVWDSLNGGKLLATLCHHHKTVTSLCFASDHGRFLSASLDK